MSSGRKQILRMLFLLESATPVLGPALFVLLACALIPRAGIEGDEAFFSWPIYGPFNRRYGITVFHRHISLMVYPYAGALKTLAYWPVLKLFDPNPWSVRLPVVTIGALTIFVFCCWVRRIAGLRTAAIAALLLATDPSYLLTDTFDWGPVAIEHFLLVTACLFIVSRRCAIGFFCLGLALWNKAVFVWAMAGLSAGALIAFPVQLRTAIRDSRLVIRCVMAFALGALPLIVYNIHSPNATAGANVHPSFEGFGAKVASLQGTLDGSVLFGILTDKTESPPAPPRAMPGRLSRALARISGQRERSLFMFGIALAILSSPLWWRSRVRSTALFALVFSLVFFLTMAAVRYTGAAHHIVLLYPMPQLFVAAALTAFRPKWLAGLFAASLLLANLLVINQYIARLDEYGAHSLFTDALGPLSRRLSGYSDRAIYPLDYGIGDSLNLLRKGRIDMPDPWIAVPERPKDEIEALIANPHNLFVNRLSASEYRRGTTERLKSLSAALGYRRQVLDTIADSNGRPQFEIFEFIRQ